MALNGAQPEGFRVLETQRKFNLDLGKEIEWSLVAVDLDHIELNQFNNRFSPDEALSDEEHERSIVEEDAVAFENLKKSWESNPQFEQLIGYRHLNETRISLIAGHRRYFAAKRAGATSALIWTAVDLSPDEVEHIRDWPEVHQTKVAHSTFARYKSIYLDLKDRNDLERERRIAVWRQKGYTKQQVLKAERVFGRMDSFCRGSGETTQNRSSQVKAFEAYDQICESTFQELRDQGNVGRIVVLDKVAKSFLKHQIAHDDLKVTVEGLASLPSSDPVFKAVTDDPTYLDDVANLRRLTNLTRAQRNAGDIVTEVAEFTDRVFSKLVSRGDSAEIQGCLTSFRDVVARLEAAQNTISSGGMS